MQKKLKMIDAIGIHAIPAIALVNGASKFTVKAKLNTLKVAKKE